WSCAPARSSTSTRVTPAPPTAVPLHTELAAAGLVVREVDEGPPLRVSYGLTEAGAALEPALLELGSWAEKHLPGSPQCPSELRK
ncbi:winged helix-turn-helix transcriptional regulator, partial [Streptomyces sp. NPDC006333]|uniref:winged helix-turn-helix transcriptional regulator n=1 Tax=Streptomyces sp. NPDC006333 TaxID=3156753 RepID=UPI0033BA2167